VDSHTPEELLGTYFPSISPTASSGRTSNERSTPSAGHNQQSSSHTAPTSIGIHNEVRAGVSDNATRGSSYIDPYIWGIGMGFSGISLQPSTRQQKTGSTMPTRLPVFAQLPVWLRFSVFVIPSTLLILATYCIHTFLMSSSSPFGDVLRSRPQRNQSFRSTYFPTLSQADTWKRIVMSLNGIVWLSSVVFCIRSFRQVLNGATSNRRIQTRLLALTLLWLVCSGLDGMLRLSTRQEVSVSFITILMLMLTLSTFARHLSIPIAGAATPK
jgi:hypothetical protein